MNQSEFTITGGGMSQEKCHDQHLLRVYIHPRWVDGVEGSNPVAFPVSSQSGVVSPVLFNHNDPHVGDGVVGGVKVGHHRFLNSLQL